MNKYLLLIVTFGLVCFALFGQTAPAQTNQPVTGFSGVRQYVEQQELIIEVKSLIPASGVFQDKTNTYQKAGEYKFSFNLESIKEKSDILLNKWLKESK